MTASVETPLTASAGLSLRRNFMWMLGGNIFYALCQWAIIIVLAKLTNPLIVGQFSLGLAISTPVIMLALAFIILFGSKVLLVLYGPAYAAYAGVFVWLTGASGISAIALLLTSGLDSAKRFRVQVPMFVAVVAVNAIACAILVPRYGFTGAAIAPLIASAVHLAIASGLVSYVCASGVPAAFSDPWEAGL